jgi:hypothetical protein
MYKFFCFFFHIFNIIHFHFYFLFFTHTSLFHTNQSVYIHQAALYYHLQRNGTSIATVSTLLWFFKFAKVISCKVSKKEKNNFIKFTKSQNELAFQNCKPVLRSRESGCCHWWRPWYRGNDC